METFGNFGQYEKLDNAMVQGMSHIIGTNLYLGESKLFSNTAP